MKPLLVYLSDEEHAKLRSDSFERGVSMSSLLRDSYFKNNPFTSGSPRIGKSLTPQDFEDAKESARIEPIKFNPVPKPK